MDCCRSPEFQRLGGGRLGGPGTFRILDQVFGLQAREIEEICQRFEPMAAHEAGQLGSKSSGILGSLLPIPQRDGSNR